MVGGNLICSESVCNIHDWDMTIDDEGGTRPSGRHMGWDAFCLRIAALNRIGREEKQNEQITKQVKELQDFGGILNDLMGEIRDIGLGKQTTPRPEQKPSDQSRKPRRRMGGAPL